jgi:hypothetical protein
VRLCESCEAFQEEERSSIGGHFVVRGYGSIIFLRDENTGGSLRFLPVFMDYVMFATSEDGDPQMYFPYEPRSFSLIHLLE